MVMESPGKCMLNGPESHGKPLALFCMHPLCFCFVNNTAGDCLTVWTAQLHLCMCRDSSSEWLGRYCGVSSWWSGCYDVEL